MAKGYGDKNQYEEFNLILYFVGALIVIFGFWYLFGDAMSKMFGYMRYYELKLFQWSAGARDVSAAIATTDLGNLGIREFLNMTGESGKYARWLFVPAIVAMGVYVYMKSPRNRFSRTHTMASLAKSQAELWPEIAPVAGRQEEFVKMDPLKGPWASAMTEWEFAEKFGLAKRRSRDPSERRLNRDKAREVFSAQLGSRWPGIEAAPKHVRMLYACFITAIGGDGQKAINLLRKISKEYTNADGKIEAVNDDFVEEALKSHGSNELVKEVIERHAYTYTLMATLLQVSRTSGVLASPMFIWLKPVDRRLWYTLNGVGRYTFFAECAGIAAHWLFEKTVGSAVISPMVEKAVDGLEAALEEYSDADETSSLFR